MLRSHRRQSAALAVLAFAALSAAVTVVAAPPAQADVLDGTLTVVVNRDEDGDGRYDEGIDPPQPGIEIAVRDAAGASVRGITDDEGRFVLTGSDRLSGGRYTVTAAVPPNLSELSPVPASDTFAPFSASVDLAAGSQTVRFGVAATSLAGAASAVPPPPVPPAAADGRSPHFAVGDTVWTDLDRSGRQDPGEPPAARISVQLLDGNGDVVQSTVSSATGRFAFDDLAAGTYAVRFAGVPSGFRLTSSGSGGNRADDSDPDYTGTTPPFTLAAGEPSVRATTAEDEVRAEFIHPDVDAGITPLRYAIGDRVWLDRNGDGARQPDEPPAAATVSLLAADRVVATTTTDASGGYRFTGLEPGDYRVRFEPGEHRRFTDRNAASDPALDSDPDPGTGTTPVVTLGPTAADLVPAGDLGVPDADLVNATVGAGLTEAYAIGDAVWRDDNGNGILDSGEEGLRGVRVELLGAEHRVLGEVVTDDRGRFRFDGLPAGTYRLRFLGPAEDLVFTRVHTGTNPAVDSDAAPDGLSAPVVLDEANPADTTVDAGLTDPADLNASPPPDDPTPVPADTHLSSTGGVDVSVPIAGLALVAGGLGCVLVGRRPTLP